ncbi:Serpentine Receptor, class Z [Caenorhabditis elegans]|nr:Serpentine Receptor, class Z [Caenorhabditis elegans]CDH93463.1 Serpentine Receptor, class Z [Caenorhabditis elegans]|eukprot:NP_001294636.1 Serpentine Receptor, class Z [Caenorhabditis elegans]
MIFVVLSGIFVLIGTSETFNMLLFLLAITRAVIYFWPSNEKKIKTILIHIHKRVHYLYFAFITKTVIFFFVAMYMEWTDTNIWYILPAFVSIQVLLHVLIFVSAILHIPIMISIRKLSYLASAQQNNPQRYILWQIISVLMFKLIALPYIIFGIFDIDYVLEIIPFDCFLLPIIVQISYLGCNRRNVETLLTSFHLKKFIQVLFDRQTAVNPLSTTDQSTRF